MAEWEHRGPPLTPALVGVPNVPVTPMYLFTENNVKQVTKGFTPRPRRLFRPKGAPRDLVFLDRVPSTTPTPLHSRLNLHPYKTFLPLPITVYTPVASSSGRYI